MARIGSVPAAPFVGDQFASLYVGATRVPTVPGKPVIDPTSIDEDISVGPVNDGGVGISQQDPSGTVNWYVNGTLAHVSAEQDYSMGANWIPDPPLSPGDVVRVAWVNLIGEGPLSDPFVIPAE
jgi:hypothetical protein